MSEQNDKAWGWGSKLYGHMEMGGLGMYVKQAARMGEALNVLESHCDDAPQW